MRKAILLTFIFLVCIVKVNAQTTVHGSSDPVTLYQLIEGEFYEIITTDIWVYANGTYGATTPITLQQQPTPPTIGGVPLEDFRPIPCYDAKSDYGRSAVQCGPYNVQVVSGVYVQSCYDTNNITCRIRWKEGDHEFVVWNPETE